MRMKAGPLWTRIWQRLSDRTRAPRRWWNPIVVYPRLPRDVFTKAYKQYADTTNRTMLALLAVGTFCLLTVVSTPDKALIAAEGTVKVPFAEASISFLGFVVVAPLLLTVVSVYLHIFYGYWLDLEHERQEYNRILPAVDKKPVEPVPMLFALEDLVSRGLTALIFYCMTPSVLAVMTWKGAGRSEFSLPLFLLLSVITAGTIFLSIRRCNEPHRKLRNPLRWLALAGVGVLMVIVPSHRDSLRRPMNLFREDLTGAWLLGVDLRGANLERARLKGVVLARANLQKANMIEANLEGATLRESDAHGAFLLNANLYQADLGYADLSRAVLIFADLREAKLSFADLEKADLRGAKLQGAILSVTPRSMIIGTDFDWEELKALTPRGQDEIRLSTIFRALKRGTNLQGALLRKTDLRQAKLQGVNLREAYLREANLQGADLQGADLQGANLLNANLQGANLRGVNLSGVKNLTKEHVASAILDEDTKLPDYLKPPPPVKPWDAEHTHDP